MAEFQEVMRQTKRMCQQIEDCNKCPLDLPEGCMMQPYTLPNDWDVEELEKTARIVMDWAEKHPEPRYPSWNEAWRQLFPNAHYKDAPCPRYFVPEGGMNYCNWGSPPNCLECKKQPIPADIAEKLGIKPIGGVSDENT